MRPVFQAATIFVVLLLSARADGTLGPRPITVVLRYDDYSSRSPTALELRLLDALRKRSIPLTIGVIPAVCDGDAEDTRLQRSVPLPPEKAAILRTAVARGDVEVAIHGFSHQTRRVPAFTELIGLSREAQAGLMRDGRNIVDEAVGRHTRLFIPPWNSYDNNTIKAAEEAGFDTLSGGPVSVAEGESSLHFLPATCSFGDLREAVNAARRNGSSDSTIVALFHPYEFVEAGRTKRAHISVEEFETTLGWLAEQTDISCMTVSEAADRLHDSSLARNRRWCEVFSMPTLQLLPPALRPKLLFYPSIPVLEAIGPKYRASHSRDLALWFGSISVCTALLCAWGGRLLHSRGVVSASIIHFTGALAIVLAIVYPLMVQSVGWKKAGSAAIIGGAGVGVLSTGWRRRR